MLITPPVVRLMLSNIRISSQVQPSVLPIGGSTTIEVKPISTNDITSIGQDLTKIDTIVIDNNGEYTYPRQRNSSTVFPRDYVDGSTSETGNYTAVFTSVINNSKLASISFLVVSDPLISSMSEFVLGKGIAISFGLIAGIVTIIYQALSQRNQDILRRDEKKAGWMLDNMKHYNLLSEKSWKVCKAFWDGELTGEELLGDPPLMKYDFNKVFSSTIVFLHKYNEFRRDVGGFYFDDARAEQFMVNVYDIIRDYISQMIGDDEQVLTRFFGAEDTIDLKFKDKVEQWFKTISNREDIIMYYRSHYAFSLMIGWNQDKGRMITYTSRKLDQRFYEDYLEPFKEYLEDSVMLLNQNAYGKDIHLYYYPFRKLPSLAISLDVAKKVLKPGEKQTIRVRVSDRESGSSIISAKVEIQVFSLSTIVKDEQLTAGLLGDAMLEWILTDSPEPGRYKVLIKVHPNGYSPALEKEEFVVKVE